MLYISTHRARTSQAFESGQEIIENLGINCIQSTIQHRAYMKSQSMKGVSERIIIYGAIEFKVVVLVCLKALKKKKLTEPHLTPPCRTTVICY